MRIAVLGLGKMGHAVAVRLIDGGHQVTVWNRSPGKADDLVKKGAEEAKSPVDAVSGVEVVVTSLADDAAVLAVVTGEEGIGGALEEEATLVEMSTVSPETALELSGALGGRSLASPILGAPQAVEEGQAFYLVSGPKERYEPLSSLYESVSPNVRYLGDDVERALQLKLLANYLLLSGIAVLGELVTTAEALGIEQDVVREFLEASPLVAPALHNRLDALITGDHNGWFTTALGTKDARLAEEMAMREGLALPIAELVKRRYEEAASAGYADDDLTAVVELVRKKG